MALRITPGYKSLNLYFDYPTNAFYIDDDANSSTNIQLVDNSVRSDLQSMKIWVKDASWGAGGNPAQGDLPYYDGPFQGYVSIDKLLTTGNSLADNKTYYIKYAFISMIDPDAEITYSAEYSGTTLDISLEIQGWLTRDPIEIPTDSNGANPVFTGAGGSFTVYRYSSDISTSADVAYSVVSGSVTGGLTVTFGSGAQKNQYSVTAMGTNDLTGTATLRAVYTDPANTSRTITIDQTLNVSKRRPGQTAPLVTLTGNGFLFVKQANSTTITPNDVILTATAANIASPITYTWTVGGASITGMTGVTLNASGDELTISKTAFSGNPPQSKLVRVDVTNTSGVNVFDQETVYYVQEGSDALVMDLTNENQSISLDNAGNVISGATLTSQITVLRGSSSVAATYSVASATGINAANVGLTTAGVVTIAAADVTGTSAEIVFEATVNLNGVTTTLSKKLTINKVQDGQPGAPGTSVDIVFTRVPPGYTPQTTNTANPPSSGAVGVTWDSNPPTGTTPLWSVVGYSSTPSNVSSGWSWGTPVKISGDDGQDGNTVAEVSAFIRSVNTPTVVTPGGSYQFVSGGANVLTPPASSTPGYAWTANIPTGTDPIWEIRAVAAISGTSGTTGALAWSTPVKTSQNGTAATVTIGSVTTGSAGSSASVTNSGDSTNAVFDIIIPRGDQGNPGVSAKGIDIDGATSISFKRSSAGIYTPTNSGTLTANPQNLVSPSYNWTISGGTFSGGGTSSSASSVTAVPTDVSSVTVTLQATASGVTYTKTIRYSVVSDGLPGIGQDGKRTATGIIYRQQATANDTAPATPTATSYTFTTGAFAGLTATDGGTWSTSAPSTTTTNGYRYWYARYTAVENAASDDLSSGSNLSITAPSKYITFTGLAVFTSSNSISDGSNTINGFTNTTAIDGGQITTGSIDAGRLTIGQAGSGSYTRLFNNKIEVWDGGTVPRVKIGYLGT
jgi:hypothetical protein